MGRHKVWRNHVKKIRRKRLRCLRAQERDAILDAARRRQELSPTYQAWEKEQEALEKFREEEEARLNEERNQEWLLAEVEAQRLWRIRQEKADKARKEKEEMEMRIRKEWEEEQKKQELIEMEKKKEQEEKLQKQEELMKQIVDFVEKGGERPSFANDVNETNPNKPLCPFFTKTGACRFGDRCSRNHPRPALSKTILLSNFYSHFVPELFRYGRLVAVVICRNAEPHLRGNVYAEYEKEAEAAKAVTSLNGRWYGGKLISAQFTSIPAWKGAICGLFHRGRCPKGRACNFLHVFHNPGGEYFNPDRERERLAQKHRGHRNRQEERDFGSDRGSRRGEESGRRSHQRRESSKREWRWSESPERVAFPSDSGKDGEDKAGSERGRVVESPDSGYRGNRERRRNHRSNRERREDNGSQREKDKIESGKRRSSRQSDSCDREGTSHSSSRERRSRGSERRHVKDKQLMDRSRESRESPLGRQSREKGDLMSEKSVRRIERNEYKSVGNGAAEHDSREID